MGDEDIRERLVRLEANQEHLRRDLEQMKSNHRWAILAVVGVVIKNILDQVGLGS